MPYLRAGLLRVQLSRAVAHSCRLVHYYVAACNRQSRLLVPLLSTFRDNHREVYGTAVRNRHYGRLFISHQKSSSNNNERNIDQLLSTLPQIRPARNLSTPAQKIVQNVPDAVQPFLHLIRADKPVGTWLLFWPCAWSIAMAAEPGDLPSFSMLALFGLGAFLMRGSGCIVNDMWDRNFDRQVARTKDRPLASGRIQLGPAMVWLAGQLGLSLLVLLQLNWTSILLGASSLGLVLTYPLFKRFTYYPQVVLGLAFNWGALLGFTAITGYFDPWILLPLYLGGLSWTMVYDTIYAHQDKSDDALIGIKSTALKFGNRTPTILWEFSSAMVFALGASGYMAGMSWPFYIGLTGVGAQLMYQTFTVDIDDPADCWAKFRSNMNLGLFIFLSIVAGNLLRREDTVEERRQLKSDWKRSITDKDD